MSGWSRVVKIYVGDKMTDRDEMIVGHKVYLEGQNYCWGHNDHWG